MASFAALLFVCQASAPASSPTTAAPASAPVVREVAPAPAKASALLAVGARIGAKGAPIERPETLEPFFAALDGLRDGSRGDNVHIVTFGNSLISADNVTNIVRERLMEQFGNGGRGFVLAERIAEYGPRTRAGYAPKGMWTPYNLAMGPKGRGIFGLAGVYHETTTVGSTTEWRLDGESEAELFYLDHKDSRGFSLRVDGTPFMKIEPVHDGAAKSVRFTIPSSGKRLQLVAPRGNVTLFGLILEKTKPGIVFDTFGIPAAEASSFLTAREDIVHAQLAARRPALIIYMLGGNEVRRLSWARTAASVAQRKTQLGDEFRRLIERMMVVTPQSACLAVGPIDAVYGEKAQQQKLKTRPQVEDLNVIQRAVAEQKGCAYLDLFSAMGGSGSLEKFDKNDMLQPDLVHPKGRGLDLLGELVAQALLQAYGGSVTTRLARQY